MATAHFDKLEAQRPVNLDHVIETPVDVCPDLVDPLLYGHHRSRVVNRIDTRVRVWEFASAAGLVKFREHVARGLFRRKVG